MSELKSSPLQRPAAAIEAQAAAWLARLKGPNRTPGVEQGFRRWLSLSPEHRRAFEIATEAWEKLALLRRRPLERAASWERRGIRVSVPRMAIAMAAVVLFIALAGTYHYSRGRIIETATGEQRTLTLDDGSRVALNTATHLNVRFDKKSRRIELRSGEALFQVASRPGWPFVVVAGTREIKALGTSFVVRRDERDLAVTLFDGKVSVTPANERAVAVSEQVLEPGQRLTFHENHAPNVDTPALEKLTAWQRGQVAFDGTPMADALAEMNRYSRVKLVTESPAVAAIRISGMFRATESAEFARAVAQTYSLKVSAEPGKIVLSGVPRVPSAQRTGE